MEVYAYVNQKVNIAPLSFFERFLEKELGGRTFVYKENDKFYKTWEESCGSHGVDMTEEISEDFYNYIMAINLIIAKLKKRK